MDTNDPSDGRGDSDWMSAVICERVVRYPGHSGLETGGGIRSSENRFEDENENEDDGGTVMRPPTSPAILIALTFATLATKHLIPQGSL